jgi:trans-aconitate 2-methyltransferase
MTLLLHETLRPRETLGVDRSGHMLAKAPRAEGLRFEEREIEKFEGGPFDLIFSNAALHWVEDHARLFKRLRSMLTAEGQLAVQMPFNDDDAPHAVARQLAREHEFRGALQGWASRPHLPQADQYASWLHELGFARQHVRIQVYTHLLDDRTQVVDWVRGALLTDYEKRMPAPLFAHFLERYRALLQPQLSDARPYLYVQPRILIWGSLK